ncbi:hypothetical protein EVAR_92141_1 [Eumeta japonica]|uniref:Uncharacterized protein n=1 Tax=Eumeta variegata TaxID=151549 RepID=A0A4C1T1A5_EUMVA|nr:hypothetical protein EVAR_92141_1 [Eumeta japonica]
MHSDIGDRWLGGERRSAGTLFGDKQARTEREKRANRSNNVDMRESGLPQTEPSDGTESAHPALRDRTNALVAGGANVTALHRHRPERYPASLRWPRELSLPQSLQHQAALDSV